MFNIAYASKMPLEFLEITSLAVRGDLGPMTVWVTNDSYFGKHETRRLWKRVYAGIHRRSRRAYTTLHLDTAVRLLPGQRIGVYVHSAMPGDQGLVYDNSRGTITCKDEHISVESGMAHISSEPFSMHGYWGYAWRRRRQFVGKVTYGVKYLLWQPHSSIHSQFPQAFRRCVDVMLENVQVSRFSQLPEHVVWYIINFLPFDWAMPSREGVAATLLGRGDLGSSMRMIASAVTKSLCQRSRSCAVM